MKKSNECEYTINHLHYMEEDSLSEIASLTLTCSKLWENVFISTYTHPEDFVFTILTPRKISKKEIMEIVNSASEKTKHTDSHHNQLKNKIK